MSDELNRERTGRLVAKIYRLIRAHYTKGSGPSTAKVFECLQALATVASLVLKGTGPDPRAAEFYERALLSGMKEATRLCNEIDPSKH